MERLRVVLVLLVLLAFALPCSQAADLPAQARAAAYLEKSWRSHPAPARSVVAAFNGKIVFSEAFGFADLDNLVPATTSTVYNMGSVSKTFTAVAVMQLVEQGKVKLDDPIQKYVPAFPDKGSPITIFELMAHTSGIRHYGEHDFPMYYGDYSENMKPYHSLEESLKIFKDDPLLFRPGTYYSYSSYGIDLLQGVVEKASGIPFEDYMRQHVWEPAGMLSTSLDVPGRIVQHRAKSYLIENGKTSNFPYGDISYKWAGGGIISTAEDLVRFGEALNHGKLLKPETLFEMYVSRLDGIRKFNQGAAPSELSFGQALVWRILKDSKGRRVIYHCGTVKGFGACLLNYPDQDFVIADMANSYDSGGYDELMTVAGFFLDASRP